MIPSDTIHSDDMRGFLVSLPTPEDHSTWDRPGWRAKVEDCIPEFNLLVLRDAKDTVHVVDMDFIMFV
jgi:hypothetical protein